MHSEVLTSKEEGLPEKTLATLGMISVNFDVLQLIMVMHFTNANFRSHELPEIMEGWQVRSPFTKRGAGNQ